MADRDLLEAAARAFCLPDFTMAHGMPRYFDTKRERFAYWDPLTDDGDAFRLAVQLGVGVQCHVYDGEGYVMAQCGRGRNDPVVLAIEPGDDPCAATRRAIVRAAAAIAAHQPGQGEGA